MSAVNKTDHHGRKSIINIAAFCIASVFLNIIGSTVITLTGIPLYQDTAGTFLASICGGYLPGMIVSFITTIIRGLGDHEALYYNAVGLIMADPADFPCFRTVGRHSRCPPHLVPQHCRRLRRLRHL